MPLNKEPLALTQSPRAAADARQWVSQVCRELGRHELVECAELGTSELVSNAILHAEPPIRVRVRGTSSHPRIEVSDGSPRPPVVPAPMPDGDEFLATFGRGLGIVAMVSVAWGASMEPDGKVVWFEPATGVGAHPESEPVFDTSPDHEIEDVPQATWPVTLLGVDVALGIGLRRQYSDLRRELRLLAVSHQEQYPLATNLSAMFASYERHLPPQVLPALTQAAQRGESSIDITVAIDPEAGEVMRTMIEMFDLADAFCKAERLLSLQRTPAQRAFHMWYLGEFIRQLDGQQPKPFAHPRGGRTVGSQQVS